MPELPAEVITEILTRLPVDFILCMRCVSKRWCSLIDGHGFVKTHLSHSLSQQRLIFEGMGTLSLLNDFDGGINVLKLPFEKPCFTFLLGSCNGLLLLKRDDGVCLLNPSIREFVILPDCPVDFPTELSDSDDDCFFSEKENYGLGYDLTNDDYKVVKIVEFCDKEGESLGSRIRVYSSKSNSWGRVRNFPYSLPDFCPFWGANVGGALHTNVLEDRELVIGLDLSRADCYPVPLPECFDRTFGSMHVTLFDGCLCLLGGYLHHRTDVWIMKEYGVKESWTKLFAISPPTVDPYFSIVPLIYLDDRDEVLLNYENRKLIGYDLKRKTTRDVVVENLPQNFHAELFVESLCRVRGFDVMRNQGGKVKATGKKDSTKREIHGNLNVLNRLRR